MTALLLAEFAESTALCRGGATRARARDYRLVDAFTPFPVEGVHELLEQRRSHIRVAMFIGGIAMAALAYGLEYYSAVDQLSLQQRRPAARCVAGLHAGAVRDRHPARRDLPALRRS